MTAGRLAVGIALGAALLAGGYAAFVGRGTEAVAQQHYEMLVAEKVMVPTRDGSRLALDIYYPAKPDGSMADGTFPAIMNISPYGRPRMADTGRYFAQRGFVFAAVDSRGAHDSEGTLHVHINDGLDGHDIVEWLARQPWSTGKVGTYGISYHGNSQFAVGLTKPPSLKTQFIVEASTDYHDGGGPWNQGAWMHDKNLGWSLQRVANINRLQNDHETQARIRRALEPENYRQWLARPASQWYDLFGDIPELVKWHRDWLDHPTDPKDHPYWKQYGLHPSRFGEYPEVPIHFVGAWYDLVQRSFIKSYVGLSRANNAPKRLVSGPWIHGGHERVAMTAHGDIAFGPEAAGDLLGMAEEWMRHWLKGEDTGLTKAAPVRIFVMGTGDGHRTAEGKLFHGGYWRDEQEYPLARAEATRFYLQPGGGLAQSPPPASEPSRFAFDPANPVPTIYTRQGGGYDQRCQPQYPGCTDTRRLSERDDVLVFRTAPLEADMEITGPMAVTLHFSSDARDTDFSAKLVNEYPPSADFPEGFDLILVDALRRARFRATLEREELLTPGQVYEMTIELPPTSNVFKKGTRLRLDISSSNYPKFGLNPNTGEPIEYHTHTRVANNRVYHAPGQASFLEVPIVPGGGRAGTN